MATAAKFILTLTIAIGLLLTADRAGWITFKIKPTADIQEERVEKDGNNRYRIHSEWLDPTPDEFTPDEVAGQYTAIQTDVRQTFELSISPDNSLEVHIGPGYGKPATTETYPYWHDRPELDDDEDDWSTLSWRKAEGEQSTTIFAFREFDFEGRSLIKVSRILINGHSVTGFGDTNWLHSK